MRWTRSTMATCPQHMRQAPGLPSPKELGKHPGEWVAIVNRKILASGKDALKVLAEARLAAHGKEPSMFRVPTGEILLL